MLGSFLRDLPLAAATGGRGDAQFNQRDTHRPQPVPAVESDDETAWLREPEEFEFVMGRRQIAGVAFVVLVILSVFSTVSYLAGRWTSSKSSSAGPLVIAAAKAEPQPLIVSSPALQEKSLPLAASVPTEISAKEPPIFGEPVKGTIYLQMAAVDRGMANVMVNGLRRLGFPSIIAAGPNDRIFRVLVGPLADAKTANATRTTLEAFGLSPFSKKIEDGPARKPAAAQQEN